MRSHLYGMRPNFHEMGWDRTGTGSHSYGMGLKIFSWDGMGPDLCGMGAPGPVLALCQDRDGMRSWWDGSSHPGPTASLAWIAEPIKQQTVKFPVFTKSI